MIEVNQEEPSFQPLSLKEDKAQCIEAEEIDFEETEKHLEHGGSVLITSKSKKKLNVNSTLNDWTTDQGALTHI
jgi:hypothetical protein